MLDRFYRKRYKILGGPGCGKTTKILDILADYIKAGVNLDEVLLIGFAKATAEELRARVIKNSLLTEKQAESRNLVAGHEQTGSGQHLERCVCAAAI